MRVIKISDTAYRIVESSRGFCVERIWLQLPYPIMWRVEILLDPDWSRASEYGSITECVEHISRVKRERKQEKVKVIDFKLK